MESINITIECQKINNPYGCSGISGGDSIVPSICNDIYYGYIGDFDVYLSKKTNNKWYVKIWSKNSSRCDQDAFCYAECLDLEIVELEGELYGEYGLPLRDICNNIEKACGKIVLRFN